MSTENVLSSFEDTMFYVFEIHLAGLNHPKFVRSCLGFLNTLDLGKKNYFAGRKGNNVIKLPFVSWSLLVQ
jgi:hypothetical protein